MSRRAKGPRLWLRKAGKDRAAAWLILDGPRQRGTGFGPREIEAAEAALADYLTEKHSVTATAGSRDPSQIPIDDVLALYATDVAPGHARPGETAARIVALRGFWGGHTLDYVTGPNCRAYAITRPTPAAARRELEDFRAAINHHRSEGLHDKLVSVKLPPRGQSRERWLTRQEAARLIRSAWRYREIQKHVETDKHPRRHVARFMVVARYMGSRAAVICGASIETKRPAGRPWVDLATGVFYGRPVGQRVTRKRRQTVRVPTPLLAHLRRWRAAGQRYAVEWQGEPVGRISKAHAAAVAAAGFGRDVTPHTWRHTVATWLMQAGADPWKVAGFLGMSLETLTRVYGHHHPEHSADVHAALRQRPQSLTVNHSREQKAIPEHT